MNRSNSLPHDRYTFGFQVPALQLGEKTIVRLNTARQQNERIPRQASAARFQEFSGRILASTSSAERIAIIVLTFLIHCPPTPTLSCQSLRSDIRHRFPYRPCGR